MAAMAKAWSMICAWNIPTYSNILSFLGENFAKKLMDILIDFLID